jgi:tetratricopeptide (TPR) repeat protein
VAAIDARHVAICCVADAGPSRHDPVMMFDRLRSLRLGLWALVALFMLSVPAAAQTTDSELDQLFAQLRAAPDAQAARDYEQKIWQIWTTPDDPELRSSMSLVMSERSGGEILAAISDLEVIVEKYPDYAEGWNQLATMHFFNGDYDASLAATFKALELEPRHFGALAGQAVIYDRLDQRELALKAMIAALAIHPFLPERALFPELETLTHT